MAKPKNNTNDRRGVKKRTSIGNGKVGFSTMNKHKKRSYKKYNRQGK